jgi:hypothetical protein
MTFTEEETKRIRETLKIAILKGLPEKLFNNKVIKNKEVITISDKGKMWFEGFSRFGRAEDIETAISIIGYLATELAEKEIDLWIESQYNQKSLEKNKGEK